jgi:hypothetical protein
MASRMGRDRRYFLTGTAAALLGGASVIVSACGSTPPTGPPPPDDRAGTISLNHGHEAIVTVARLAAGAGFTLEIQGSSAHGHAVELSAADLARIRRGEVVRILSTAGWEDKHDHWVTFNG